MGISGMWTGQVLTFIFFAQSCVSAPDECLQETIRLRAQLRTLQGQVARQHILLQQLRDQGIQTSTVDKDPIVHGGPVEYIDCAQAYNDGKRQSGSYVLKPLRSSSSFNAYCDMSDGGGWTVFQRRSDGSVSFDRAWAEYKTGFGNLASHTGEFWLGNDYLHYLTSQGDYALRVNMEDFDGNQRYAVYRNFKVASETNGYQLQFGEYSGTAGDSLAGTYHPEVQWWASHQGMKFSTYDRDHDRYERNCAREDKGGWWFNRCHSVHLNGYYYQGPYSAATDNGVVWYTWHGWWYSLKSVEMKIRPMDFESDQS
ncbi:fibrinogen-like protein 1 [Paramormyrops kingsleyae]|uniref:Fibrinogen-like protein 1 n=1 Tax=Paramormyrops kingsleyae TaxID=1676925 RepID=A0A3B3QR50_9TELE|nr:fibrinogen-like protein 1 [Paramormyrops kingsleyae]